MMQATTKSAEGERLGDWILTFSGIEFWPLDARPEEILIEDIAVALSRLPRFTGHTAYTYSVGQHSVYVANLLRKQNKRLALAGLLHDGSEAYTNDISNPLKQLEVFALFRTIEDDLQTKIFKRFGLTLSSEDHEVIKLADRAVFSDEVKQLMCPNQRFLKKIEYIKPGNINIEKWGEAQTFTKFMKTFEELYQ